ncbi:uncharacterized protein LOC120333849 [Styela clava]|uniref:uncharacterized protein LOC120333849 n=1 Tax=Styela clava TaxID=7725 RepID=UPI00193ADED5|nr:uncharacterized protein LOC120333849 [Styela clava]
MTDMLQNITFGTVAAVVIGALFGCLGCIAICLLCCRRKIATRRPPGSSQAQILPVPSVNQGPCYETPLAQAQCLDAPPSYEDLARTADSPPPYEYPTLLTLSRRKSGQLRVPSSPAHSSSNMEANHIVGWQEHPGRKL